MPEPLTENPSLEDIIKSLGFTPELARFLPVEATVESFDSSVETKLLNTFTEQGIKEAAGPVENGRPRMLKMTAWMAHGGPANRNGDAFLEEDLQKIALDGLFAPPYLGIMDFNHDFNPYGVWYSAEYKYNQAAGQYGLLAEGALFAWRFPELADKILAEQTRKGFVDVSMAAMPEWIEEREGADGRRESVLRKPVFVAVSILDVAPGDPNARGFGSESEDSTRADRETELNKALLSIHAAGGEAFKIWHNLVAAKLEGASQTISQEETQMDEKIIEQLTAALQESLGEQARGLLDELKSAVADAAKVPGLEATIAQLETTVAELTASLAASEEAKDTAATEVESLQTALQAKNEELSSLSEAFNALKAEHDKLTESVEAEAKTALREARLAKLPEGYRKALEGRSEESRERIIARYTEMSDEEFTEELEVISVTSRQSFADRSAAEGGLSTFAGAPASGYAVDKFLN